MNKLLHENVLGVFVTALLGVIVFGHISGLYQIIGGCMILIGGTLIVTGEGRNNREKAAPQTPRRGA